MFNLFKHKHYPTFFLSISDLMQPHSQGLFSFTLISNSKKTLETGLDLMPSFKTSIDTIVEGLVLNVCYLENQCHNFIQKKYGRSMRSHKGQNSAETRCCGFLVLEPQCCSYSILESQCCCLLSSEKNALESQCSGLVVCFLMSWCLVPES